MNVLSHAVAIAAALAISGAALANDNKKPMNDGMKRESNQPVDDTWITTKVKSALLAEKDVSGLKLEVETVNGVVHLRGNVSTEAEKSKAKSVAMGIEGVKSVDTSKLRMMAKR